MKVAITGGTGFIGSHCVAQAVEAGHEVRMLVRNLDKARSFLAVHEVTGPVEIVEADLTDHPALRTGLVGMDALLHVGAVFTGAVPGPCGPLRPWPRDPPTRRT